jgi:hypothetical protein
LDLLNFRMPPLSRITYASKPIKGKWEPKIRLAEDAYVELEKQTVIHGLRQCKTQLFNREEFIGGQQELAKEGLVFLPIKEVGKFNAFTHFHTTPERGKPSYIYGAIATDLSAANKFAVASAGQTEHQVIGKLLGYPECCTKFFIDNWASGFIDPVWQQYMNLTPEHTKIRTEHRIRARNTLAPETNSLLKYVGVRIMPHIPCSPSCEASLNIAKDWVKLGRDLKINGIDEMMELLSMPVEWDALNGIGYISTPIFKLEIGTVTCYPKYVVQREGTFYPKEAPAGLKFPWNEGIKLMSPKNAQ